jgi:hypothetical protein
LVNVPSAPNINETVHLLLKTAERLSRLAGSDVVQDKTNGEPTLSR